MNYMNCGKIKIQVNKYVYQGILNLEDANKNY